MYFHNDTSPSLANRPNLRRAALELVVTYNQHIFISHSQTSFSMACTVELAHTLTSWTPRNVLFGAPRNYPTTLGACMPVFSSRATFFRNLPIEPASDHSFAFYDFRSEINAVHYGRGRAARFVPKTQKSVQDSSIQGRIHTGHSISYFQLKNKISPNIYFLVLNVKKNDTYF